MTFSIVNFIRIKQILFLLVAVFLHSKSVSQSVIDLKDRYNHGKDLYEKGAFQASRVAFSQTLEYPYLVESQYFLASSAIKAGHEDGESLMNAFVSQYPNHLYAREAYLEIADYYFENSEYTQAAEYYDKSNITLSKQRIFKKGYSEFKLKKYQESLETFGKLEGSLSNVENDAAYFVGYMHNERNDKELATKYIQQAFESKEFRNAAIELYVSLLYENGDYQNLINTINSELTPIDNGSVLNYLADAQYALERYNSAVANYSRLFKEFGKHKNEKNFFRAGFSSFKIQNEDKTIEYLKKAAVADDSIGAYASYYLGVTYFKQSNWHFAISSFQNTTKYATVLKQDAVFHQARSLMKIQDFSTAIQALKEYLTLFPNGKYAVDVNQLLGAAYAETNDYDLAIRHFEELDEITPDLKSSYQRVSFLKGVSLFNDKNFPLAGEYFQKSLLYDVDSEITQQTYYWMGEILSLQGSFDDALFYYASVNRYPNPTVFLKSIYGRAYAKYNLKDYEGAIGDFVQFEKNYSNDIKKRYLTDVFLRIGDCHFALKQYQEGIEYYAKAEKSGANNLDYIYFQVGLLNRYLDKDETAKTSFNRIIKEIPESPKVDHAYYQIAQIDFEKGENKTAIESYSKLLRNYPSSEFVPYALLNQAVAYDNEGQSKACISNYKEILDRFPRHQTANSALLGLQDKQSSGEFNSFDDYLVKYKNANPNSEALENIEFESARANFYAQKYTAAIEGLENFIKIYPNSSLLTEAQFLVGDAYYRQEEWDKSLLNFKAIESKKDYSKYDRVLYRLATIESLLENLENANYYYYQLANESRSVRNVLNVYEGLMENYFKLAQYDSAIHYGTHLLNNPKTSVLVSAQANLIIGKSFYQGKNFELALQNFLPLVSNAPNERGAEAYYYISKIYFDQANYNKALESLFILTDNFKSYELWLGRAYLLMADIYIETNELFQAKATLNSLISNATLEEITIAAKSKLELIENTNDSNE